MEIAHRFTNVMDGPQMVEDEIKILNKKNKPKWMILSKNGKGVFILDKVSFGKVHRTKIIRIQPRIAI